MDPESDIDNIKVSHTTPSCWSPNKPLIKKTGFLRLPRLHWKTYHAWRFGFFLIQPEIKMDFAFA